MIMMKRGCFISMFRPGVKKIQSFRWSLGNYKQFTKSTSNSSSQKKLFTPGPLSVSHSTKEVMLSDVGSRDADFLDCIKFIRQRLLDIAGVSTNNYTTVLLQGSGTYAVEATLSTAASSSKGRVLILANGAYGMRMDTISERLKLQKETVKFPEGRSINVDLVERVLKEKDFSAVALVHCETSTGVINPINEVGSLVKKISPGAVFVVDAMSSFGGIPVDFKNACVDFLVSSANKCLEGVPGFAFVIASKQCLLKSKGNCHSFCLDLVDQYEYMEKTQQFRFTPPTHVLLAFQQALLELEKEGNVLGRAQRYQSNHQVIREGMKKLGFQEFVPENESGYIITSFLYPNHSNFNFAEFYRKLSDCDQLIYPGKVTELNTFRVGNIGHLYPKDMSYLLLCIEKVLHDMKIPVPLSG